MIDATCSVDGCEASVKIKSAGLCGRHYQRQWKTGDPTGVLGQPTAPLAERFWDKVTISDGCWLWTAGATPEGYGRIYVREAQGPVLAHRVAWLLATNHDPGGLCVLHLCDNPPCVNPDHLVLGSQRANIRDMVNKGRQKGRLSRMTPYLETKEHPDHA